ncbi:MAG: dockerin type I repeat-containing protein, partial [Lachnospirales bacterium]
ADCPHSNCTNGFCNICDEPETPKLIDGNYQIANYGNLVWFQQYVDSGNLSTNAVLTEDITANNKLLDENGDVLGTPKYKWTPIAQKASNYTLYYNGVFDGQGHTISGLYAPYYTTNYCALFGNARGTVKNIFITDSYFGGSGCYYACSFVGNGGCNIENCGSDAVVAGTKYCGGIAGINYGKITSCYFAGKISATTNSNAIASDYDYNYDLIRCYYLDDCGLTSTRATSMEKVKFASGEVCYLLNDGVTDGTQAWYQTIGTDTLPKFKGRIVGYNESANPQYFNLCDDEHQWSEKPTSTIDPTCTEDGYDIYTCTVCGYTKNVANNTPASHKWSDTPTSTVDPTCTEDGYDVYTCTVCGETKNVANNTPASHKWGTPTTVDPTCTEDGYDVYTCTVCGATKNVANNTPASHKWGTPTTVDPTCTEDGYDVYTCTVCGKTKNVANNTPASHKWGTPTTVDPTCTEDGYDVYTCTVCGETKNVANNTPASHKWGTPTTVDPTCTEDGYDVYTCTVCGATKNVANNTPASHKWGTPTTVDPTCTEDGYDVYTCTVCGKTKNEVNDGTALGHNPNDDGICTVCHKYVAKQPANGDGSLENPYQIENYGHLMWFQEYVDSGHYSVNAVLTKDIIINEDVYFDENFELSREPEYVWTPISMTADASTCYSGVFDGQGHTIRGLFAPYYDDCCGLFGRANGTIKNVFITFSYFGSTYNAATFVGYGYDNCVIENCGSEAFVGDASYCGGIAGQTSGEITNCYFAGMFLFDPDISDAIVNDDNENSTITNCYYLDTCGATSEGAKSKTVDQFESGEVCYLLNDGVTDGKQTWYQTLTTDTLPKFKGKTVYYSESASPQYYNDTVTGDVSGNDITDKVDATLVLRYSSGIDTLNAYQLSIADVNGDGKADMLDVIKILELVTD